MNNLDKHLILDLSLKEISEDEFFNNFSLPSSDLATTVRELLRESLLSEDPDDVEYPMLLGFIFNLYNQDFSDILSDLLLQDWHYKHEDIVSIMQTLKDPRTIEPLYLTATKTFQYLKYDDSLALARKCTWALSEINTSDALEKLEKLAQSDNSLIKSYAQKRLTAKN